MYLMVIEFNFIIMTNNNDNFNLTEELKKLKESKRKDLQIIGLFIEGKQYDIENKLQIVSFIKRYLRASKLLEGYKIEDIQQTIKYLKETADFKWTLETIGKYIDEEKVRGKKNKEEVDKIMETVEGWDED